MSEYTKGLEKEKKEIADKIYNPNKPFKGSAHELEYLKREYLILSCALYSKKGTSGGNSSRMDMNHYRGSAILEHSREELFGAARGCIAADMNETKERQNHEEDK